MRLLSSFIFLVGALSVGAVAYFPTPLGSSQGFLEVIEITAPPKRSPQPALAGDAAHQIVVAGSDAPAADVAAPYVSTEPAVSQPAPAAIAPAQWRTIVTATDRAEAGPAQNGTAAFYELVRNLQRELLRVGCYAGEIDSDWGPGSRRAMSEFLAKINATLPVDRPDYILLTLLQGHVDKACGVSCRSGHGLSSDGRCVPNVIVADGPPRGSLLGQKTTGARMQREWQQATTIARSDVAPAPARPDPKAAAPPKAFVAGPPETSPPQASSATAVARAGPDVSPAAQVRPLPGRMAVGAPPADEVAIPPPVLPTSRPAVETVAPAVAGQPSPAASRPQPKALAALEAPVPTEPAAASATAAPFAVEPQPAPPRVTKARPRRDRPARGRDRFEQAAREGPRYARGDSGGTVRTYQGRVRRGSPQHNLMLSLGGVF